jgi:hypothetical protein
VSTYRLWPSTNGPSGATSFSGPFGTGTSFEITGGQYLYLAGYYWWVCPAGGQSTAAQKFALWQTYGSQAGTLVSGGTVTSGTLSSGWNYVPLSTPVPLTPGVTYHGSTAFSNAFPLTAGQFASGGTYAAGITQGPLFAYSDSTGSAPDPWSNYQCGYQTSSSDPTTAYAGQGDSGYTGWLDVQITTAAPSGATYRLYPSYPRTPAVINTQTSNYTLGLEFALTAPATLNRIWHYSASGAAVLPSRCGIWSVATQTEVSGSDNGSPSWSGAAGSGYVSCTYSSGPVLPAGSYKVSTYSTGGSEWFSAQTGYWSGTGAGSSGLANGILSASNEAGSSPGQSSYATGSWAYPSTDGSGETYWLDVEVTPVTATPFTPLYPVRQAVNRAAVF